ncbi:hypothetical protein HYX18_03215, partial [Candidatus Woesearchaeota archaeon]|nr:hypothetical protein [Candidatus Woesearchaeota archaeon]
SFIFLIVFVFRILFVLNTSSFTGDLAYFHLRHAEHIIKDFKPLFYDDLSYGGRNILYPPLFHYFLAFFSSFLGIDLALKLIPEFFISLLVIVVYLIANEISKDQNAALISALISGFVPLLVRETLNKVASFSLLLPLLFYMLYCFIRIGHDKKYVVQFAILSFLLPLIDPTSFIVLVTLLLYVILLVSESVEVGNIRKETIFFSVFIMLLINFIIYKNVFYKYGLNVLKSSIPKPIFELLYRDVSLLALIYFIGILTLLFGVIGLYYGLFKERKISIYLISSLMLSVLLLTITKFIDFASGLIFIGVSFSILVSLSIKNFFNYLALTKFNSLRNSFFAIIIGLIAVFSIYPSITTAKDNITDSLSKEEIWALVYIKANTPKETTVLSRFDEGHLITSIAERKNVMDSYFLLIDDIEKRFEDIEVLYLTPFTARALELIRKYHITYIYLSESTKKQYGIEDLIYTQDKNCFELSYQNERAKVYKVICE